MKNTDWSKLTNQPYYPIINFFIEKDYKKDLAYINYSDDIINNIDIITKKINCGKLTKSMKTEYKKEIYKLLLKTHPDKCKLPNINAHEITQQLTLLLQKIKI